jgi:NarL family two-component system response regulator LiaR
MYHLRMERIRVLIVEDHPMIRLALVEFFADTPDIECIGEADNGAHAVELATTLKPDVVLLDLLLLEPMKSGFDVAAAIQQSTPIAKILIYSAVYNDPYIQKTVEMGLSGYITKTSAPTAVINGVRTAYEGGTYYSEEIAQKITLSTSKSGTEDGNNNLREIELDVLQLLSTGKENSEIAHNLSISVSSVQAQLANIFRKLDATNRTEAVVIAVKRGLVVIAE